MATLCPKCRSRYADTESVCPVDGRTLVRDMSGVVLHERYTLRDLIGLGGMGSTVWRAVQSNIGRSVAIKLLPPTTESAGQRFEREAKIASNLNHPHIVTVHDFGQAADGSLFLVMEFLEGRTLHRELRDNAAFPLDRALRVADQTLRALEHAHAANVVHRDLKPGNLFLTRKGDDSNFVKVLDFGLAKYVADSVDGIGDDGSSAVDHDVTGQAHIVCGTPNFMAPEQVLCGRVDGRADIYAMGVVLFRMLTGQTPFGSESNYDLYRKVISQPPPTFAEVAPGHEIPARLEEIVRKAMAKSADDRYSTARHMRLALREVRHSLGVLSDDSDDFYSASSVVRLKSSVVSETPSETSSKQEIVAAVQSDPVASKRRGVWVAFAVLLLCSGAVAMWYFGMRAELPSNSGSSVATGVVPDGERAGGKVVTAVGNLPAEQPKGNSESDSNEKGDEPTGFAEQPRAVTSAETNTADLSPPPPVNLQPNADLSAAALPAGGKPVEQENVAEPPVVKKTSVEITSEPSAAQVAENGTVIGVTPYLFESEPGNRELVVLFPGYKDYPIRVELDVARLPDGGVKHHAVLAKLPSETKQTGKRKSPSQLGIVSQPATKISGVESTPPTQPIALETKVGGPVPANGGEKRFKVVTLDDGVTRDAVVSDKKPPTNTVSSPETKTKPLQIQVLGATDNPQPGAQLKQIPLNNPSPPETKPSIRVEPLGP
ncbi:MAG: serine/threonine protein kinase [Myxococcales bacterium]|nr:serine/threonine protein kinase [Myxococcales bacterium]